VSRSPSELTSLVARDLRAFWHPCSQMRDYQALPPLEVVRAEGCRLHLADGRVIFDAISSWWCKSLGHGHPHLRRAVREQLDAFEHVMVAGLTHQPLVALCERLLALANGLPPASFGADAPPGRSPGHFGRVFLADNGSTGVEVAIKMALQAQAQRGPRGAGRTAFASFSNGYHGETVGALSVGDLGLYGDPYRGLTFPVHRLEPLPYRSGPPDPRWLDPDPEWTELAARLSRLAPSLAAIVYEPVLQAAGGMRLLSPALFARLATWAREHDVYLIADEIAAGMGRVGAALATHLAAEGDLPAVLPDFLVLSKGLTAGFLPLSAVLTTDTIYELFDSDYFERKAFLHSNTYAGNALAVAAALATLDVYAREDILGGVPARAGLLLGEMRALVAGRPFLRNLRAAGMVAAVDLASPDGKPLDPRARTGYRVYGEALQRGGLLRPLGDTMYLFPPLNAAADDLRAMVRVLGESVDAVLG
jgi:adenosylmethionine---8-amino-7-oxononanoate aminotransferase